MSDPVYVSNAKLEKVEGVHRRAYLETGAVMDVGVHGQIKAHYKIDGPDLPLPVDYLIGAAAT
jgi:hypothetical protein